MWASNSPATSYACAFLCVWGVGCTISNQRLHFNQLASLSIQFSSRSYASLPDATSVFSHFKSPCRSEKLKTSSWVINLVKNHTPKFPGRVLYRNSSVHCSCTINSAPSMWSTAPASSVVVTSLSPMAECMTLNNMSTRSITLTKESDRKYAEDNSHFVGCEMPSSPHLDVRIKRRCFPQISLLSAADHDIYSGVHFCKSDLRRTIYLRYAQNLITTLKTWFCYTKVYWRVGSSAYIEMRLLMSFHHPEMTMCR